MPLRSILFKAINFNRYTNEVMTNDQINRLTLPIFENLLISNIGYLKENNLVKDKNILKMLNSQVINGRLIVNSILKSINEKESFIENVEELNDALSLMVYQYLSSSNEKRIKISQSVDNICNEIH